MKKSIGPIIAVLVTILILGGGYLAGKKIAKDYNEKHNTNKNIFQILKIDNQEVPIKYPLEDGSKTIKELCEKDTGICERKLGKIKLNNKEVDFQLYTNFDNPNDEETTYFKLNNTKIGSFIYLDEFAQINNQYLIVTEPNSTNNNYVIRIYDDKGKMVANYDATKIRNNFEIKDKNLYFHYCNLEDISNGLPKVSYFRVNSDNITQKNEESHVYEACN